MRWVYTVRLCRYHMRQKWGKLGFSVWEFVKPIFYTSGNIENKIGIFLAIQSTFTGTSKHLWSSFPAVCQDVSGGGCEGWSFWGTTKGRLRQSRALCKGSSPAAASCKTSLLECTAPWGRQSQGFVDEQFVTKTFIIRSALLCTYDSLR